MSDWVEKALQAAEWITAREQMPKVTAEYIEPMLVEMARHQREALLSEESVERAARAVADLEPGEDWPTNAEMGGGPTGTRDDEYRSECARTARAALTAALGEDESDE